MRASKGTKGKGRDGRHRARRGCVFGRSKWAAARPPAAGPCRNGGAQAEQLARRCMSRGCVQAKWAAPGSSGCVQAGGCSMGAGGCSDVLHGHIVLVAGLVLGLQGRGGRCWGEGAERGRWGRDPTWQVTTTGLQRQEGPSPARLRANAQPPAHSCTPKSTRLFGACLPCPCRHPHAVTPPLSPTCRPKSARLAAESWPPPPRRMSGSLSAAAAAAMDCGCDRWQAAGWRYRRVLRAAQQGLQTRGGRLGSARLAGHHSRCGR